MMLTERTVLSAIEPEDIPAIVRWRNDPAVYKGFIEYEPLSIDAQERFMATLTPGGNRRLWLINARDAKAEPPYQKRVRPAADAIPVGTVGIMEIDRRNRRCELGPIFIGELEYRGRGVAFDAERLVLDWCFNHLGMHKVYAHVVESNAQALAFHEKLGFARDVLLREHILRAGRFEGVHHLSCLEEEFRERLPTLLNAAGVTGPAASRR